MSILLLVEGDETEKVVAQRLLAQGDEVRVLLTRTELRGDWIELGAHVAVGDPSDDDLIERAGQDARTIVLFGSHAADLATVTAALKAAAAARIERVILCVPEAGEEVRRLVTGSATSYVILSYGRRLALRARAPAAVVAEAVDAADDLAGDPRLEVDLRDPDALDRLGPAGHSG